MNQFGGSRTDTLVKLVLIFFISLLSFSVGTFIGKTVTEKQYKDTMYEPSGEEVEQASNDEESKDSVDDEALSLTDEFAKIKKEEMKEAKETRKVASDDGHGAHAPTPAPTSAHENVKPKAATMPAPKAEKIEKAAAAHGDAHGTAHQMPEAVARVAAGKPPTDLHKAAAPKAENLPHEVGSTTASKYTIQIASYAKEDEANKHSADLNSKGFSSFVVPAQIKGQTWFRVSVGQFPTQSEAAGYKEEFMKKSNISKVIIQKISQ